MYSSSGVPTFMRPSIQLPKVLRAENEELALTTSGPTQYLLNGMTNFEKYHTYILSQG